MTKEELEKKVWYRVFKVLYIVAYSLLALILVVALATVFAEEIPFWQIAVFGTIAVVAIEAVKRGVLYVATGKAKIE